MASVYAGVFLVTNTDILKFEIPEISQLKIETNNNSNFDEIKNYDVESVKKSETKSTTIWTKPISLSPGETYPSNLHCGFAGRTIDGGVEIIEGNLRILTSKLSGEYDYYGNYDEFAKWSINVINEGTENGTFKSYMICEKK